MAASTQKMLTPGTELPSTGLRWKVFVVCLSYANLCFFNVWAELQDQSYNFFRTVTATWAEIAGVTCDILILAVILWFILVSVFRRRSSARLVRLVKWGTLVALLYPMNLIRTDELFPSLKSELIPHAATWTILLGVLAVAGGAFLVFRWERISTRLTSTVMVLLLPALPLAMVRSAAVVLNSPPSGTLVDNPLVPALPQKAGAPHVVWILFDEWDQSLTFPNRPATLSLPELDRFREEALYATKAEPAGPYTMISVPSLFTGKRATSASTDGARELKIRFGEDRAPERMTAQTTVFSEARKAGFNVGIVGWYFPYCRLFKDCTACTSWPSIGLMRREEFVKQPSLLRFMGLIARRQFFKIPLVSKLGIGGQESVSKALQISSFRSIRHDMLETIADPRLNVVFVHFNIPHPLPIYDIARDTLSTSSTTTYVDNLKLVDRTLGDVRRTLENAGMWESTSILLTSDHPLRLREWAQEYLWPKTLKSLASFKQATDVPFLLKLAGHPGGVVYPSPFQTRATKELMLAILQREVSTPEQAESWLDTHRSESPAR